MRKMTGFGIAFLLAVLAGFWWVKFAHEPARGVLAVWKPVVGPRASWEARVSAAGWPGLRRVEVLLDAAGRTYRIAAREYPAANWIGSAVHADRILVRADLAALGLRGGPARVRVAVETYAWQVMAPRRIIVAERPVRLDLTAPSIGLVTIRHNVRLGGSAAAVFRVSEDTVRTGVEVDHYFFPATRGYFADPTLALALFAVPQDLHTDARPRVVAEDGVGNRRVVDLPCHIRDHVFRQRSIPITDRFLERKVPELIAANNLPAQEDLVKGFVYINRTFRRQTGERLRRITAKSASRPLWNGAFRRQPRAQAMSRFADRRIYFYHEREIDRQTHLGYDLASVRGAAIEAAQNGVVLFAGPLGIYGNAVVIDHGLGVASLYGHLRTLRVSAGQQVQAGTEIGQSGETGLAGGDHLHFSILLHGVQVDPVEWWDAHWLADQVTSRLEMFPRATDAPEPAVGEARDGA